MTVGNRSLRWSGPAFGQVDVGCPAAWLVPDAEYDGRVDMLKDRLAEAQ